MNVTSLYRIIIIVIIINNNIGLLYTVSGKKGATRFFAVTSPNPITDLQNSFTITLSSKFAINKLLNVLP